MLAQRTRWRTLRSLGILGLAVTLMALGGCAPAGTSAGPSAPPLPPTAAPTQPVADWWALFPAAPPGLGEQANHLAFFSNRSGAYELYQVAPDGSGLAQLSHASEAGRSAYDLEPAWSTDGKLAFTSDHLTGHYEVFVLYPGRPDPAQLTGLGGDSYSLAWSRDNRTLLFVATLAGDDEIYSVGLDGGPPVNLTQRPDARDFLPTWSPDNTRVAFVSDRDGAEDIYVMAPDGSGVSRLTDAEGNDTSPAWSPDGTQIAFVSERAGGYDLYVMRSDGSQVTRLTENQDFDWSPTWSPDGTRLAFTSTRDNHETYDLYVMSPDGSNPTRVTSDPANDILPRWWP